jgi:S-adenosylmethionine:tRNA ribosyltransferase-isomerase
MPLKTSDFDFDLPERLIARYPLPNREDSRLLHYNLESQTIKDRKFKDIVEILEKGDLLIRNTSPVLPARLFIKEPFDAEILLVSQLSSTRWKIIGKPTKKLKKQQEYKFSNGIELRIEFLDNELFLEFRSEEDFKKLIREDGSMPIPPYLKREAEPIDLERYQCVYANTDSTTYSVAAPTAGLHFTQEILCELETKGVEILDINLEVGLGTFLPVKSKYIDEHKMHSERFSLREEDFLKILDAKKQSRRVIAVGSTSTRCIESLALKNKYRVEAGLIKDSTNIFIYPGSHKFKILDGMITNFHLAESSLIMLVAAFIFDKSFRSYGAQGIEKSVSEIKKIYQSAIKNNYRFYSYGDASIYI